MNADTIIKIATTVVTVTTVIIGILQTRKSWYIKHITEQRIEWANDIRRLTDALISDYYAGQNHLSERIDSLRLYLTPTNQWQKCLVCKLTEAKKKKLLDSEDMDGIIEQVQVVLRYNRWAIKTESFVTYRMDKRRDKRMKKRASLHQKAQGCKNTAHCCCRCSKCKMKEDVVR